MIPLFVSELHFISHLLSGLFSTLYRPAFHHLSTYPSFRYFKYLYHPFRSPASLSSIPSFHLPLLSLFLSLLYFFFQSAVHLVPALSMSPCSCSLFSMFQSLLFLFQLYFLTAPIIPVSYLLLSWLPHPLQLLSSLFSPVFASSLVVPNPFSSCSA